MGVGSQRSWGRLLSAFWSAMRNLCRMHNTVNSTRAFLVGVDRDLMKLEPKQLSSLKLLVSGTMVTATAG